MLELASSHVEKSLFELRLEGEGPKWARWINSLGPIRARLFALSFVVGAALLNFTTLPAAFFMDNGWAQNSFQALNFQAYIKWVLAGIGLILWMMAFGLRKENLILVFDRLNSKLLFRYSPQFSLATIDEGEAPFSAIKRIEVFGPHRDPKTAYGFLEIEITEDTQPKVFRFKILSEDQFRIYPTNLSRITGREPIGDWTDPDLAT